MTKQNVPIFTFEQELALSIDRNISLMANAGSGKTFVLVERFRKIINEKLINQPGLKVDTSSILAITFTKKAAAEMKKKVIDAFNRELEDMQKSNSENIVRLEQLKRIREGLTYSNISTIHSFCANLLRKFPVEAGIPINFAEMSEAEKHQLIDSSIDTTIDSLINAADIETRNKMEELIVKFGRNQLKKLVALLINKIELFDEIDLFLNKNDQGIRHKIIQFFDEFYHIEEIIDKIKDFVNVISNDEFILPEKRNGNIAQKLNATISSSKDIILEFVWCRDNDDSFIEFIEKFYEFKSICYTQKNKLNRNLIKIIADKTAINYLEEIEDILMQVENLLTLFKSFEYLDEYLELSRNLWDFVQQVRDTAEDAKIYLNELDFDDLQMKVKNLLKNKNVVKKIRSQLDYIMIDEFQDTNQLQYDIVKALVPEISDNTFNNDDINLFIVGDPKQSIYGFRNADVRVFFTAVEDIYNNNLYKKKQNRIDIVLPENAEREIDDVELLGKNRLTSTFRLRPEVAAFVNKVCSKIMDREYSSYDVDYSQLVCSRETDRIDITTSNKVVKNKYSGKVVFLLSEIQKYDNDNIDEFPEEEIIADYIKSLVNDSENNYEYKDIAILSRTKTHFANLTNVMTKQDIPFVVHSGNTFFTTEEITDFISFLNFIYNPDDDIALISILRAPFFNIDDTKLLILKGNKQYKSLWGNLRNYVQENDNEELRDMYIQLNEILELAPSMSITQVILMIIEKTGWMGVTETHRNKHQKFANIDKLIELARQYEQTGFKNIYDFVEQLKYVSENEIIESEAAAVTGENTVNIMTIHAAKGLQFPVVIIYKTNSKSGGSSSFSVSGDFGFGFSMRVNSDDVVYKKVDTPIHLMNKIIKKEAETAEDKRILYVAMTRAEDILVLSVQSEIGTKGYHKTQGLIDYILNGLDISIDELFKKDEQIYNVDLDVRKDRKIITTEYELQPVKIFNISKPKSVKPERKISQTPLILLDPIQSQQKYNRFSPSKLKTYDYSSELYFDRYILGVPDELTEKEIFFNAEMSNTPGNVFGSAIHFCLQNITKWLDDTLAIDDEKLEKLIEISLKGMIYQNIETVKSDIFLQCKNIAKTELIKNEYNNIKNSNTEYYLAMPLGSDILHGYIDLLLERSDGSIEVWDWKSNQIKSDEDKAIIADSYKLQMQIYTYFISKLYPGHEKYTARLLFTRRAGKNKKDEEWTHVFTWDIAELNNFEKVLANRIDEIKEELYL